ncbi:unnamed protein product [marine sediment metagenome]|uniref:Uncharacterized protein n=1 Tax=marine sediment metagenome TaxID=412755 RepID=X1MLC9_9ZZZZ
MIKALIEERRAKDISSETRLSIDFPNKLPTANPPIVMTPFIFSGVIAYT